MPSGTRSDYDVLYQIGSGSYGTCKKIRRKRDGKILVWKQMEYGHMNETEKEMLVSEVNLLRELKHKHIVRYYDRIVDRANATIYIVMEYCEGGDLNTLIAKHRRESKHFDESFVWKILVQTVQALKLCHQRTTGKTILHRDLKPANIFLDSSKNVKLGDFGLARVLSHDTSFAKTFVGTPYYMSPEQMNYMSYNDKSDIWSLGCMIYELCALRPPFTATNQKELAVRIRTGRFARIPMRYSDELNQVISNMLTVQEYLRPSIDSLLRHPSICKRLSDDTERIVSNNDNENLKKEESLQTRERVLEEKEKTIKRRERELEAKEKALCSREKKVAEKLARAENLYREYKDYKFMNKGFNTGLPEQKPLTPCLVKSKKENSPKKKVQFVGNEEKENFYNMGLDFNAETKVTHYDTDKLINVSKHNPFVNEEIEAERKRNELRERLYRARLRSDELRKAEIESKLRTKQLLAMR